MEDAGKVAQLVVYAAMLADPPTSVAGAIGAYATLTGTAADIGSQAFDKP